jgi:hypothetical protein
MGCGRCERAWQIGVGHTLARPKERSPLTVERASIMPGPVLCDRCAGLLEPLPPGDQALAQRQA